MVRSVSGDIVVGAGNAESGPLGAIYAHPSRVSDLVIPGPTLTWVYVDEHPDSINDAGLFAPSSDTHFVDIPANYHNGACGLHDLTLQRRCGNLRARALTRSAKAACVS
jgi:hypothetical protein